MIGKSISDPAEDALELFDGNWAPVSPEEMHALLQRHRLLDDVETVAEFIRIEIEHRYDEGLNIKLSGYLDIFPCLAEDSAAIAEIAYEDYRCRTAAGFEVVASRYINLPGVAEQPWFRRLEQAEPFALQAGPRSSDTSFGTTLRDHRLPSLNLPLDDDLERELRTHGFYVVKRIGSGAFSNVYLATQNDLADRYVVLKVVEKPLEEPQKLAMLQHTNIVPIYSFHRIHGRSVICMPYAGGVTMAEYLSTQQPVTRSGQSLVATVHDQIHDTVPDRASRSHDQSAAAGADVSPADEATAITPLERLRTLDCSRLATWIFQRLAAGLAHSHARGILHGDLKPANVLIRNDGEPAILDFNLSRSLDDKLERRVGGTLPYMPPEGYRNLVGSVDDAIAASDIYSLGVMLYEFVTGRLPYPAPRSSADTDLELAVAQRQHPVQWMREDAVPVGLRRIIEKCLAFNPENRYQTAESLHRDLVCEHEDRSLQYAPEPMTTRFRKWNRRHPRSVATAAAAVLLAMVLIPTVLAATSWRNQAQALAAEANFTEFVDDSNAALATLIVDPLRNANASIEKAMQPLILHGLLKPSGIAELLKSPSLSDEEREDRRSSVFRHLAHVAWMEADRLEAEYGDKPLKKQQLARFDQLLGAIASIVSPASSRASMNLQAKRASMVGDAEASAQLASRAETQPLTKDNERYLEAVRLQTIRQYRRARDLLTALADRKSVPSAIRWTMLGRTQLHLRDYEGAKISFTQSLERAPEASRLWHLRGLCYRGLRQPRAAYVDYTKALDLEPEFSSARWGRARALIEMGELEEALADLNEGLKLRPNDPNLLMVRSKLLAELGREDDSLRDFNRAIEQTGLNSKQLYSRGSNRLDRDPEGALRDLRAAAKRDRKSPTVLIGLATALTRLGKLEEAIEILEKVEALDPNNEKVTMDRAVLLARLGGEKDKKEALDAYNRAIEPPTNPATLYQAACVNALLGDTSRYPRAVVQLAKAVQGNYGLGTLRTDPDLEAIRNLPRFQSLLATVSLTSMGRDQSTGDEIDPFDVAPEFAETPATD